MAEIVPLHLLNPGETASICEIDGDPPLVRRLDEMGLRVGVEVRMIQPGQPCIVALDHQRLSFRGEDGAVVFVEVDRP